MKIVKGIGYDYGKTIVTINMGIWKLY